MWVDTFDSFPINSENLKSIPSLKKCLVSPERWGREQDINKIVEFINHNKLKFELIMTDINTFNIWKKAFDNFKMTQLFILLYFLNNSLFKFFIK